MQMGLREANQEFARAIRAVRRGSEVVLTDRGKSIAVIRPLAGQSGVDEAVRRLERIGWLRAAQRRGPLPSWRPRPIQGKPIAETVREGRRDRV